MKNTEIQKIDLKAGFKSIGEHPIIFGASPEEMGFDMKRFGTNPANYLYQFQLFGEIPVLINKILFVPVFTFENGKFFEPAFLPLQDFDPKSAGKIKHRDMLARIVLLEELGEPDHRLDNTWIYNLSWGSIACFTKPDYGPNYSTLNSGKIYASLNESRPALEKRYLLYENVTPQQETFHKALLGYK